MRSRVEKAGCSDELRELTSGITLKVDQVDLICPNLFRSQVLRRLAEVLGKVLDLLDVASLGAFCAPSDPKVLEHSLSQRSHRTSFHEQVALQDTFMKGWATNDQSANQKNRYDLLKRSAAILPLNGVRSCSKRREASIRLLGLDWPTAQRFRPTVIMCGCIMHPDKHTFMGFEQ